MPGDPRQLVWEILCLFSRHKHPLDHLIEDATPRISALDRKDEKLFYAILMGVLRWRGQLDWVIAQYAHKPLNKLKPPVRNLLRMGAFQIRHLERVPDFAAINTTVALAKRSSHAWASGLVNGLLRKLAANPEKVQWPDPEGQAEEHLAVTTAMPLWLVKRWAARHGLAQTRTICQAGLQIPPLTLRCNPCKTDRSTLMEGLRPQVKNITETALSPWGLEVQGFTTRLTELPLFKAGHFQIQDEAAQLAVHLCDPRPGQKILDACAGLGTKTGHLAGLVGPSGDIRAVDKAPAKIKRLQAEMQRLGFSHVTSTAVPLESHARSLPPHSFEAVLVDAPCSGWGVLRRNPDAKWLATAQQPARLAPMQERLLASVARLVKPEGRLVYSVCTTEPEETDLVVDRFLNAHPQFEIDPLRGSRYGIAWPSDLVTARGCLRSMMGQRNMDGFFAVCLRCR